MKKQSPFKILIAVVIVICVCILCYDFIIPKPETISYTEFTTFLNNKQIKSAEISDEFITFTLQNDETYQTANPQTPDFKEKLLLADVTISNKDSLSETFSLIFDIIFYGIFVGIFLFVFLKFISPNTYKIIHKTGVTFDDVIGMQNIKANLLQIADILKNPQKYKNNGMRLPKGILLEGAPGNGKTLFARALAGEAGVNFIPAKATDFESMFMAIGPMKVKLLFKKARRHTPCIVFIDEFDGIGTKRTYSGSAIETENTRIVTALLNELDGFTPHDGILVLAATNSRNALDEALIRPGRFDAKYTVPYPDAYAREELIKLYTKNKKMNSDLQIDTLVKMFDHFSAAHIESTLNRASLISFQSNKDSFDLDDIKQAIKEL